MLTLPLEESHAPEVPTDPPAVAGESTEPRNEPAGRDVEASHQRRCVKGTLHVCGNSVLFEPLDKELPIVKAKYRAIERLSEWRPNKDERAWLRSAGVQGYRGVKQGGKEQTKSSPHRAIGDWFAGLMGGSKATSQPSNGEYHVFGYS